MFIIRLRIFVWVSRSTAFVKMSAGIARCIVMSSLMIAHLTNIVVLIFFARFAPGILVVHGRFRALPAHEKQVL